MGRTISQSLFLSQIRKLERERARAPSSPPPSSGVFLPGSYSAPPSGLPGEGGCSEIWNHRVSLPLSPAARYQNELAGVDTELLAERFYYQALSVAPQIGKWTLAWASQPASFPKRKIMLRWQVGHTHSPGPYLTQFSWTSPWLCILPLVLHTQKMMEGEEKWESLELRRREAEEEEERRGLSCP